MVYGLLPTPTSLQSPWSTAFWKTFLFLLLHQGSCFCTNSGDTIFKSLHEASRNGMNKINKPNKCSNYGKYLEMDASRNQCLVQYEKPLNRVLRRQHIGKPQRSLLNLARPSLPPCEQSTLPGSGYSTLGEMLLPDTMDKQERQTILAQDSAFPDWKEDRRDGVQKPPGIPFPNSKHGFNRIRRGKW